MAIKARFDDARENPSAPVWIPGIDSSPKTTRSVATMRANTEAQISAIAMFRILGAVYFFRRSRENP
jgi:hypothetical protein